MMLSVKNLRVSYGKIEVVRDISFKADEGEIVTLIGHNGASKSTILKAISGIKIPISGEIWFQNKRIDGLQPSKVVRMGLSQVPEGKRLFPYMTVKENLLMGAYVRKDNHAIHEDLESVFEKFPILKERSSQAANTLSGGQQQMLTIGRALMSKPRLLLLDEPTLGLAPIVIEQIANIIKSINMAGTTLLLVEQNARLALGIAHRGYVIETGKIVLDGKADEIAKDKYLKKAYLGI
jgi:branched-chain amino acid transport system ATP-binding protein